MSEKREAERYEKREAERYVDARPDLTFGGLREMLVRALDRGGMSAVNPSMTKAQALGIFASAIAGHREDERVHGGPTPTRNRLIATNIVRECVVAERSGARR